MRATPATYADGQPLLRFATPPPRLRLRYDTLTPHIAITPPGCQRPRFFTPCRLPYAAYEAPPRYYAAYAIIVYATLRLRYIYHCHRRLRHAALLTLRAELLLLSRCQPARSFVWRLAARIVAVGAPNTPLMDTPAA